MEFKTSRLTFVDFDKFLLEHARKLPIGKNAINVGIARVFPGLGVSSFQTQQSFSGLAITSGTQYFVPSTAPAHTAALVLQPTVTAGRIRIKVYNGAGTSPTLTKLQIVASDGTNSVVFDDLNFGTAVTLSTTSWFDYEKDFLIDTAASGAGGGAVGQLISGASATSGNGGITAIGITATLGGTSPAATMDVELLGLI